MYAETACSWRDCSYSLDLQLNSMYLYTLIASFSLHASIKALLHLRTTESPTASRLPLLLGQFWLGPVEHLQELGDAVTHSTVHVGLAALDVVVQIVSEQLDARDGACGDFGGAKVSREENKGDVSDVVARLRPETFRTSRGGSRFE